MRKTILVLVLLLSASDLFAQRQRIVNAHAVLSGRVIDATGTDGVYFVDVTASGKTTRTRTDGSFSIQLPIAVPTTVTFSRTGYEPLTETITLTGAQNRTFQLQPKPVGQITTSTGATYMVDSDSVEFGYAVPFLGIRHAPTADMCRPGVEPFTLDRSDVKRIIGPAKTITDETCCNLGPLMGADFELANGEVITAYFVRSCQDQMQIFARDHKTYQLVAVELAQLTEAVFP